MSMRVLTHYELTVLIANEIENMHKNSNGESGIDIYYACARARDILRYCDEYWGLTTLEE